MLARWWWWCWWWWTYELRCFPHVCRIFNKTARWSCSKTWIVFQFYGQRTASVYRPYNRSWHFVMLSGL